MHKVVMSKFLSRIGVRKSASMGAFCMAIATLMIATPAMAHHPFGGEAPQTIFEGIISGIGHPVLGPVHFAFVIAVGLLAAVLRQGITVPLTFLLAALTGTGLHLQAVTLPGPEFVISGSVLLFGLLLVARRPLNTRAVVALTAVTGLFHGFAYGEAVIGAEPTPLVAYLIGFTLVQGAIALIAYHLAQRTLARSLIQNHSVGSSALRQAGFFLCGAGAVFLSNLLI
jgi:urease accessory protein